MEDLLCIGIGILGAALDKRICEKCGKEKSRAISIDDIIKSIPKEMLEYWNEKELVREILGNACTSTDLDKVYDNSIYNESKSMREKTIICKNCFDNSLRRLKDKFDDAYINMNQVETYPATYKKAINLDTSVKPKIDTYYMYGGKWNTINIMKFWAWYNGYDTIYNMTFNYDGKKITGVFAKRK